MNCYQPAIPVKRTLVNIAQERCFTCHLYHNYLWLYSSLVGTAEGYVDYHESEPGSVRIIFMPDTSTQACTIEIFDDEELEEDETFTVRLTNPQPPTRLGEITSAVVTILNEDGEGEYFWLHVS